jgi:hypothetical protein
VHSIISIQIRLYAPEIIAIDDKSILRIISVERGKMLYTACVSILDELKRKVKPCYVMVNHGNDVVVPDQSDLEQCKNGALTWEGFKLSYLAKLMKPEAEEWMKNVSVEAVSQDVVLVSEEEGGEHLYRVLLADMMMNMFSGHMNLRYMGELGGLGSSN